MKFVIAIGAMVASLLAASTVPAAAAESPSPGPATGALAPAVKLQSVVAGKAESYDLQAAAEKRPVVLYFFPKAFTAG